jgi:DNA-binding cell septation regulator SpoVG
MIEKMRKAPDSTWKTKAFFSLRTKNFLIHNCRLVLAENGRMIAMMPYREYRERGVMKFETIIEPLAVDYLEAVTALAVEAYQELVGRPPHKRLVKNG